VKIWTYTLSGLLAGFAGLLHTAQNHQGSPNTGMSYELEAIAAVVIGGTHLAGGRGSIAGTVVGTLTIGVLTNVLRLNNIDSNLEMVLKAVIIIAAVWLQQGGERRIENSTWKFLALVLIVCVASCGSRGGGGPHQYVVAFS